MNILKPYAGGETYCDVIIRVARADEGGPATQIWTFMTQRAAFGCPFLFVATPVS
jgi:hypothetical protein